MVWIAALLAAILPLDRLVGRDIELGHFDQLRLRGVTEEAMMAVRLVAHWVSFGPPLILAAFPRSEEHTSELQSQFRISYAVFCLKKKKKEKQIKQRKTKLRL